MIVIVCGGRYLTDHKWIWNCLDTLHAENKFTKLIEGASDDITGPLLGADYWSHQWAISRNIEAIREHAFWKVNRRSAGPIRNALMIRKYNPDLVVKFPGGRGTEDMVRKAVAANIKIVEFSI
jgi:hypothetical protein